MTSGCYPSPWFAPLAPGRGDGWFGPFWFAHDVGVSAFHKPLVDSDVVNSLIAKMYRLLEDPASAPYIFWAPDGCSFMVRCVKEFCMSVLPEYFEYRSYAKFILDLSTSGFRFRFAAQMLTEFAREGFVRESGLIFQKGFGWKLTGIEQAEFAKKGFVKEQTHPLQKVHTPIPVQSPPPCPSLNCYRLTSPSLHKITYLMVDDPATDHLISWSPSGRSFIVWNPLEFCRDLLPKHFEHQDFYKFLMELCMEGFKFRRVGDLGYEFARGVFVRSEQPILVIVLEEKAEIKKKMAKLEEKLKYVIRGLSQLPHWYLDSRSVMALLKGTRELKDRIKEMEEPSSEDSDMEDEITEEMLENCTEIGPDLGWIQQEIQELNEGLKRQDDLMECFLRVISKYPK